jgi:hypothetical protein
MSAPEDLGAETLAEAVSADLLEVRGRDAAMGGEAQSPVALVSEEDPGGFEAEAAQDLVERDLEDLGGVVLAVNAGEATTESISSSLSRLSMAACSTLTRSWYASSSPFGSDTPGS